MTPEGDKIEVKKLASKNTQTSQTFIFDNTKEITIGRDSKCDIPFVGDKAFSKIQTTLMFDKDLNCWKIKDGSRNKNSTNGTWYLFVHFYLLNFVFNLFYFISLRVFANHSYEIFDKLTFRVGNSKMMISFC